MNMSEEELTNAINKFTSVIKLKGVLDIKFRLTPLGIREDEFYMDIKYIVPDDSIYLNTSTIDNRLKWNNEIRYSIKSYFNADVIINSTGISSESYYNKQKEK
jgi:hypothetical protein